MITFSLSVGSLKIKTLSLDQDITTIEFDRIKISRIETERHDNLITFNPLSLALTEDCFF